PNVRTVVRAICDARAAGEADHHRRARTEDRRRILTQGRQGGAAPRPGEGRLRDGRREGRRDRGADPEEEGSGRTVEAASRIDQPAGAVRLGDPARLLAPRRLLACADTGPRARRRTPAAARPCPSGSTVLDLPADRLW